jgi:hypothetical protein
MDADQVLLFRLGRVGLGGRDAGNLPAAAACPSSDFARDAALLALSARRRSLTRAAYEEAADDGRLVVAHVVRGAIHALAPRDFALYGRALIARDDNELGAQLGRQVQRLAAEKGFAPTEALAEVSEATKEALSGGRALSKNELHEELRGRVNKDLMPWCRGCKSHHVAPMLWRYGTIQAGARLDSERRYLLGKPGRAPAAGEVVKHFLHFYGPSTVAEFADWAGVAKTHAERLWARVEGDLTDVPVGKRTAWALRSDRSRLESPPQASGIRLIPAGDPYLQKPNRPLLAPEAGLRKRLFRPVASPGVVLRDGRLSGLWRAKAKGQKLELTVEKLGQIARSDLAEEAQRVAAVRGGGEAVLVIE